METAALIVAVLALAVAFLAMRRAGSLQERLDRATSELHDLRSATNAALGEIQNKLNDLRLQARRQSGQAIFDPRMTISEAMAVHPKVVDVLTSFHLGGCSSCAVSDVDTIEGACQTYGINQAALMNALNDLVSGGSGGSASTLQRQDAGGPGLAATVQGARISNVKVSN